MQPQGSARLFFFLVSGSNQEALLMLLQPDGGTGSWPARRPTVSGDLDTSTFRGISEPSSSSSSSLSQEEHKGQNEVSLQTSGPAFCVRSKASQITPLPHGPVNAASQATGSWWLLNSGRFPSIQAAASRWTISEDQNTIKRAKSETRPQSERRKAVGPTFSKRLARAPCEGRTIRPVFGRKLLA